MNLDNPRDRESLREDLALRVREIRKELYGEHGSPDLAEALGLSHRAWSACEEGIEIPGEVMLGFLAQTKANPKWLLTGQGPRYWKST